MFLILGNRLIFYVQTDPNECEYLEQTRLEGQQIVLVLISVVNDREMIRVLPVVNHWKIIISMQIFTSYAIGFAGPMGSLNAKNSIDNNQTKGPIR